ncbi:AB hydrolase superfamily protein YdjP [Thermoflexales bacterium]|nr:AB hydrolase superfamily protein YdjP [Thermoflexales bacterium]
MIQTNNGYINVGDGEIYYEVAGQGEPLVLSHAGFVDSRMWDDQWSDFAQQQRVIRFDMRGFGKSALGVTPIERRRDLDRLLQQLDVPRAALLGCSLSGEVMLDFALEHPEKVTALILVSTVPGGFEMQGPPPAQLIEMMGAIEQGDLVRASELQNCLWIDGPFRRPEQVNPEVRQHVAEMNQIALANGTWGKADLHPANPLNPPARQRLNEVRVPTLIIVGGLDHPEVLRAAEVMAAAIPQAEKVIIPDGAHLPNLEQPAEFNQAVLNFLRRQ